MIHIERLVKTYRVSKRERGLIPALKSFIRPNYSTIEALKGISFDVHAGEIVGYIGPNGAGKSSTIKIMSGILVPDSGTCIIDGRVPWKERIAHVRNIGVVFGQRSQLLWDVPVLDSFGLLKDIYRIPQSIFAKNERLLIDMLDIGGFANMPVRQLSLGQRMRCELAASLLHDPAILFLDEPTIGLDAPSKLAVRRFITSINKEKNVTVILTTHDMSDIEALARRIIMIGKGEILYDGDLDELRNRFGPERIVTIDLEGDACAGETHTIDGARLLSLEPGRITYRIDTNILSASRAFERFSAILPVRDIKIEDIPVDELIVRLYKEHRV